MTIKKQLNNNNKVNPKEEKIYKGGLSSSSEDDNYSVNDVTDESPDRSENIWRCHQMFLL